MQRSAERGVCPSFAYLGSGIPLRASRRPDLGELLNVLGKDQIERPLQRHSQLLFQARQLAQVNRAPQPPGDKAGKLEAENFGHAGAPADGSELADGVEDERSLSIATDRRDDIASENLPLTQRMLRGRWAPSVGRLIRHRRAIAQPTRLDSRTPRETD
jgi:hypothetical protein